MTTDPREVLAVHARRRIGTFLASPTDAEPAFWDLLYGDHSIDHDTAIRVANQLEKSPKKIADVLDGWRPALLQP